MRNHASGKCSGSGKREQVVAAEKAAPRSFKVNSSVAAFFFLVADLRPALTSVGPVLDAVQASLGLSGAAMGLLATLPLLIFAAFSPFASTGRVRCFARHARVAFRRVAGSPPGVHDSEAKREHVPRKPEGHAQLSAQE